MVKYNRIELLSHPVCQKYLEMKWSVSDTIESLNQYHIKLDVFSASFIAINVRSDWSVSWLNVVHQRRCQ